MKKFLSLLLSAVIMFTASSVAVFAVDMPFASGYVEMQTGEKIAWELSEVGGTLTVSGEGSVPDFEETPEWLSYNFKELVVCDGIQYIGSEAFLNAENLKSVKLASSVEGIGQRAFYGCGNIEEVAFSDGLRVVGAMAFYGCNALKEIKLPEALTEIGSYAFGYCCDEALDDALAKIDGVVIFSKTDTAAQKYAKENEITFIDLSDYTDCFEYRLIDSLEGTTVGAELVSYTECPYSREIIIPEEIDGFKILEIGENLFSDSQVESVYIPATVETISVTAFEGASCLTAIICEDGGQYGSVDGVLYENGYTNLVKVPEAKTEITQYPEELKTVVEGAFRNSSVKKAVLPETIENIEKSAFAFSNIEEIVLPIGITDIAKMSFYGSEKLKSVTIPESVSAIGTNAFGNCTSLDEIYLPYGLESIEGAAFHCTAIKKAVIPDSVKQIGDYAFGYFSADDIEFVKTEMFEICGRSNTVAEEYATLNDFYFEDVSPKQPAICYAYTDRVSATVFWEKTEDAERYEIYRKSDAGDFEKIAEAKTDEDTVFCDMNVENGVTYNYCIVAVKDNLKSALENQVSLEFVKLSTPKLVNAQMTKGGIAVKWKGVSDAEGYILYRKDGKSNWTEIAEFKGKVTSYEDTTCESGNTYCYTVKAYKGTVESGCDYEGVSAMYLSIPKLKKIENVSNGIKIKWEKVEGATGYIIGRKSGSNGWSKLAETGDVNSYKDKTVKSGTEYTYTVVPVCGEVKGFYNETGLTYRRIPTVTTESAVSVSGGVKITWKSVLGCTGYKIYRKDENGSYIKIATVKGSSKSAFTDEGAKSGVKYYYAVRAYKSAYMSAYTQTDVLYLATPVLSSAKSQSNGVKLKWKAVEGVDGYNVYRKTGNGSYKKIASVKGASCKNYTDKSAKKGKTYSYRITAYKGKTASPVSVTKSVKVK